MPLPANSRLTSRTVIAAPGRGPAAGAAASRASGVGVGVGQWISSPGRWHSTKRPSSTAAGGSAHCGAASGQRGAKAQPSGIRRGSGMRPASDASGPGGPSMRGRLASRPSVYGWAGARISSAAGAHSTILPA